MLGDVIAGALPALQAHAESMMGDSCVVKRVTGASSGPLGEDVITYATVYDGPCKVQDRALTPSSQESGSSTADVFRSELHVPVSAGPFLAGDVVFMGEDTAASWRILAPHVKTWQTAQRLPVERVS